MPRGCERCDDTHLGVLEMAVVVRQISPRPSVEDFQYEEHGCHHTEENDEPHHPQDQHDQGEYCTTDALPHTLFPFISDVHFLQRLSKDNSYII